MREHTGVAKSAYTFLHTYHTTYVGALACLALDQQAARRAHASRLAPPDPHPAHAADARQMELLIGRIRPRKGNSWVGVNDSRYPITTSTDPPCASGHADHGGCPLDQLEIFGIRTGPHVRPTVFVHCKVRPCVSRGSAAILTSRNEREGASGSGEAMSPFGRIIETFRRRP